MGGVGATEVRRIKDLEEENRKLKQLVGEQALVIQVLKEYSKKRVGCEGIAGAGRGVTVPGSVRAMYL